MLSRSRKWLYSAVAAVGAAGLTLLLMLAADVYAHSRQKTLSGINIWGYRGEILGRKKPNETRLVMLGGSTTFGWGTRADETISAYLERRLNERGAPANRRFSVANLGIIKQGAYSFRFDLSDYDYLDYDAAVLYEGYNDLGSEANIPLTVPNLIRGHRDSPVFALTGYFPILPLVLHDKSTALLTGGDVNNADRPGQVVFRPGLASRVAAGALDAAAQASQRLEAQLGRLSETPNPSVDDQCVPRWKQYCGAVRDAVEWALQHNKRVLFVTQPYIADIHVEQQANVLAMLRARFGGDARVATLNLGRAIDLRSSPLCFDGIHLIAKGNELIASHLVDPVLELVR